MSDKTFNIVYRVGLTVIALEMVLGFVWVNHQVNKHAVVITEQDEVRWCLNRLTDSPHDQKAISYYCYELHGFELMDRGVKPNYDKFPKLW